MSAHEYLSRIIKIDAIIANKYRDIKRWSDVARSLGGISSGERVQTSSNFGRVPDAVCRYVDLEREIEDLKRERAAIIRRIEGLPSDEYKIIYAIYVDGATIKEVAYRLGKSYDGIKKRKKKALRMIQSMIDNENNA